MKLHTESNLDSKLIWGPWISEVSMPPATPLCRLSGLQCPTYLNVLFLLLLCLYKIIKNNAFSHEKNY